jgi:hypothetical protein
MAMVMTPSRLHENSRQDRDANSNFCHGFLLLTAHDLKVVRDITQVKG